MPTTIQRLLAVVVAFVVLCSVAAPASAGALQEGDPGEEVPPCEQALEPRGEPLFLTPESTTLEISEAPRMFGGPEVQDEELTPVPVLPPFPAITYDEISEETRTEIEGDELPEGFVEPLPPVPDEADISQPPGETSGVYYIDVAPELDGKPAEISIPTFGEPPEDLDLPELTLVGYDRANDEWEPLPTRVVQGEEGIRSIDAQTSRLCTTGDAIIGETIAPGRLFALTLIPDTGDQDLTFEPAAVTSPDPGPVQAVASPSPVRPGENVTLEATNVEDSGNVSLEWSPARTAPGHYTGGQGESMTVTGHETPGPSTVTYYLTIEDVAGDTRRTAAQFVVEPAEDDGSDESTASGSSGDSGGANPPACAPTIGDLSSDEFQSQYPELEWSVWDCLGQ